MSVGEDLIYTLYSASTFLGGRFHRSKVLPMKGFETNTSRLIGNITGSLGRSFYPVTEHVQPKDQRRSMCETTNLKMRCHYAI